MSLPHAWPVDQVVTEATRGRAAVLEHVHRRPRYAWHSARSRGLAQSSLRAESSPSRASSARGHSKMAQAAEVLQRDLGTGKSFGSSVLNSARPPMCSVQKTTETGSAATPSDRNSAKPMLLKKCEIFSSLMSPRAATRPGRTYVRGAIRHSCVPLHYRTVVAPLPSVPVSRGFVAAPRGGVSRVSV